MEEKEDMKVIPLDCRLDLCAMELNNRHGSDALKLPRYSQVFSGGSSLRSGYIASMRSVNFPKMPSLTPWLRLLFGRVFCVILKCSK